MNAEEAEEAEGADSRQGGLRYLLQTGEVGPARRGARGRERRA